MNWTHLAFAACTSIVLGSGPVMADNAVVPDWQSGVLADAADMLESRYIYADTAAEIAGFLREDPSRYAAISDRAAFAAAVTGDLFERTHDAHLRVFFDPEIEMATPPEEAGRRSACAQGGVEYDRLDGNIGYMRIPSFRGDEAYVNGIDTAFAALADTGALILDLRNNCGGGPHIVRHISTYFFAAPTHLTDTEMRGQPRRERWTYDDVPGERYLDRPVLVLVNGRTFSAAESFTFGMRAAGRIEIIGERTGGGGHFGGVERLNSDFTLFVPVGRTFDPRTGEGWEAEGIRPDIAAESEDALAAALTRLAAH